PGGPGSPGRAVGDRSLASATAPGKRRRVTTPRIGEVSPLATPSDADPSGAFAEEVLGRALHRSAVVLAASSPCAAFFILGMSRTYVFGARPPPHRHEPRPRPVTWAVVSFGGVPGCLVAGAGPPPHRQEPLLRTAGVPVRLAPDVGD